MPTCSRWWLALGLMGCTSACTSATETPPPPTEPPVAQRADEADPPPKVPTDPSPGELAAEAEEVAWSRVDALFSHVIAAKYRFELLEGLDDAAIDRNGFGVRRLRHRVGVKGFQPEPSCDPERTKCRHVAVFEAGGGAYIDLRAHRDQHAAGAFDAVHRIGPLTLEVQVSSSDPVLRSTLLREIGWSAGVGEPVRPGCPDLLEQIAGWMAEGRAGVTAEEMQLEADDFTPSRDTVDLDADGRPELVLAFLDYGHNADHFFFLERDGCPVLVAGISLWSASSIGCRELPGQPLCELHTHELMVHGDEQASVWRYDGTRYQEVDR